MSTTDPIIEELKAKAARKRPRRTPPQHKPAKGAPTTPQVNIAEMTISPSNISPPARSVAPLVTPTNSPSKKQDAKRLKLEEDEPTANFGVRVRRSLDDHVAFRIAELRQNRIRTSKVELTELLLWELTEASTNDLAARLHKFRNEVPHR